MALPQGINFRGTLAYVTDGANEHYFAYNTAYPTTTAQGQSCGWEAGGTGDANRSNSIDVRLTGITYLSASGAKDFRIDLPSTGSHNVGCAAGDANGATDWVQVELLDTSSSLGTLVSDQSDASGDFFFDATDTKYVASTWPGSQTLVAKTFTTTICRFRIGGTSSGTNFYVIAHIYVEAATGGVAPTSTLRGPLYGPLAGPL